MGIVLFDVIKSSHFSDGSMEHVEEPIETVEYGVYARVSGETEAGLMAVYQSKEGATALAKHLAGSKANYGTHCDGPTGWVPNVPFN